MKRLTAILLVLSIAAACVYAGLSVKINSQKENITFEAKNIQGDKSYANGIKIKLKSDDKQVGLTFNTLYEFGSKDLVTTDFTFSKKPQPINYKRENEFSLNNPLSYIANGSFDKEIYKSQKPSTLDKLIIDMFESSNSNSKQKKIIMLKDYYDFYPFNLNLTIGNQKDSTLINQHEISLSAGSYPELHPSERDLFNKVKNYIKIPVSAKDAYILELEKYESNDDAYHGEVSLEAENENQYSIITTSAITDDAIYFTINNKDGTGKIVDTSLIPGGYGIYKIPYHFLKNRKSNLEKRINGYDIKNQIHFGDIETVFKLDEELNIKSIDKNYDGTKLHLLSEDNNKLTLTVIDIKTMTVTNTLTFSRESCIYEQISVSENYVIYNEIRNQDKYYTVIAIDDKGNYTFKFSCKAKSYSDSLPSKNSMHFDGERLCHIEEIIPSAINSDNIYPAGFFIEIYTKEGFKYSSCFISSLFTTDAVCDNQSTSFSKSHNITFAY